MRTIFILCCVILCQLTQGHSYGFNFASSNNEFVNSYNSLIQKSNLKSIEQFNESAPLKSSIGITSPDSKTIWAIPDPAELEWNTMNIGNSKSIRFFLAKDDMVVQELGTFKNTGRASGILLAKNISSGDNYQVVGIELFPDDKFQIAKFATPYFSIRNKESDARKERARLLNATNSNTAKTKAPKKTKTPKRVKKTSKNILTVPNKVEVASKKVEIAPERMQFDGRNITYVKELVFNKEKIKVSIWDHGRQDGDIVSIYLNGLTVISKHLLTYQKKPIEITLDPSKKNDLFLYAHNLGEYAPNTVSVEISDGKTSENIILNSDLKSCEAVLISVKK
ncbi:hypothetical protein [Maribacter sp. HTCC2170]|uniref:hypothetical protein n=1 Tax=Maribacter sp. (strain HTCC2170 / KCCM 42371) TaxID=313603 RepID=UPI00006BD4A8|nr:hypothetical protein [Maribacter sp. HTCC2170]EAR02436.1 hypothetical protein FB2170_04095 [Maribacter sp. HTCC2170]